MSSIRPKTQKKSRTYLDFPAGHLRTRPIFPAHLDYNSSSYCDPLDSTDAWIQGETFSLYHYDTGQDGNRESQGVSEEMVAKITLSLK